MITTTSSIATGLLSKKAQPSKTLPIRKSLRFKIQRKKAYCCLQNNSLMQSQAFNNTKLAKTLIWNLSATKR
jgi:hypothetical protein